MDQSQLVLLQLHELDRFLLLMFQALFYHYTVTTAKTKIVLISFDRLGHLNAKNVSKSWGNKRPSALVSMFLLAPNKA